MIRRLPILLYHSVTAEADEALAPWTVTPSLFEAHLDHLASEGYTPLTVSQLVDATAVAEHALPDKPVAITFDDGFADFHEFALPLLDTYRFTATVYVVSDAIGGTAGWLRRDGASGRRMMDAQQVLNVASGPIEIGAHSLTHPALDEIPLAAARREIEGSKAALEALLDRPVRSFAYPHGYAGAPVRSLVEQAGFSSAVAVRHAMSSLRDDRFGLARLVVGPDTRVGELGALLEGWGVRRAPFPEQVRTKMWRTARRARRRAALARSAGVG